jgi:hypothetical protein
MCFVSFVVTKRILIIYVSMFNLCQNWIPKYSGRDKVLIMLGVAGLMWSGNLFGKQGILHVFTGLCLMILLMLLS